MRPLLLLLLAACSTTSGEDTFTDTGATPYDGPTSVDDFDEPACDELQGWRFGVDVKGWAPTASLAIRLGDTVETHSLPTVDYDPDGYWDRLERRLAVVAPEAQKADQSTRFTCDQLPELTFLVAVNDRNQAFADCIVWGAEPSFFLNQTAWSTCRDASDWHSGS